MLGTGDVCFWVVAQFKALGPPANLRPYQYSSHTTLCHQLSVFLSAWLSCEYQITSAPSGIFIDMWHMSLTSCQSFCRCFEFSAFGVCASTSQSLSLGCRCFAIGFVFLGYASPFYDNSSLIQNCSGLTNSHGFLSNCVGLTNYWLLVLSWYLNTGFDRYITIQQIFIFTLGCCPQLLPR